MINLEDMDLDMDNHGSLTIYPDTWAELRELLHRQELEIRSLKKTRIEMESTYSDLQKSLTDMLKGDIKLIDALDICSEYFLEIETFLKGIKPSLLRKQTEARMVLKDYGLLNEEESSDE